LPRVRRDPKQRMCVPADLDIDVFGHAKPQALPFGGAFFFILLSVDNCFKVNSSKDFGFVIGGSLISIAISKRSG